PERCQLSGLRRHRAAVRPEQAPRPPPPEPAPRAAGRLAAQARAAPDRDRLGRAAPRDARDRPRARLTTVSELAPAFRGALCCPGRTREGVGWRTNRRRGSATWQWSATAAVARPP